MFDFPKIIFEDVEMTEFETHNKKQVSEDFVAENFNELGFYTFKPHSDTGIDLIIEGYVCKNCHQPQKYCSCNNKELIRIKRYIQIKTRGLKNNVFGYTLKTKDFRVDPRHIFILYCDSTNDFFILPMLNYLEFFWDSNKLRANSEGESHFSIPSFRKGNNKINSLKKRNDKWMFKKRNFETYINKNGLKLMCDTYIDETKDNFKETQNKIKWILERLMHSFTIKQEELKSYTSEQKEEIVDKIERALEVRIQLSADDIKNFRKSLDDNMNTNLNNDLKESRNKYLKKFKGVKLHEY